MKYVAILLVLGACTDESVPFAFIADFEQPILRDGATTMRIEESYPSYAAGKAATISIEIEAPGGRVGTALVPGYCDTLARGEVEEERRMYRSLALPLRQTEMFCTGTEGGAGIVD